MTMSPSDQSKIADPVIGDLLGHPLVLRAAWMRIDGWYRSGNLAPQPELSLWRLHPEGRLRGLRGDILNGSWVPSAWPQIPFPKKGARLRHYTMPTVRDQVAFMAYLVLLGPVLDGMASSVSFGNRWYRPVFWNRRKKRPAWELLPYPLLTGKAYLPYARSHGLFRRVAHWAAAHMTGTKILEQNESGPIPNPEDYSNQSLPPFVKADWWKVANRSADSSRGFWATLDVELAFPSIRLEDLRRTLIEDLWGAPDSIGQRLELEKLLSGYPAAVVSGLSTPGILKSLTSSLIEKLHQVEIDPKTAFPRDTWDPGHAQAELPPANKGLPTGLAVSGFLLNAALSPVDRLVVNHLQEARPEHRGAFLRFADDMILLSRSKEGLFELIDVVWRGLSANIEGTLASGYSNSNLYLNISKTGPDSVNGVLHGYLKGSGWNECKNGKKNGCDRLLPPRTTEVGASLSLASWWEEHRAIDEGKAPNESLDREAILRDELGPFVTTLVERMSDIGRDTLSDRFGTGPRSRLLQLHELIRFEIDDQQVRPDTRRLFAANRLVGAWLSGDANAQRAEITEIRTSVAYALQQSPWKTAIWRAIVRAAARRPNVTADDYARDDQDDRAAKSWLTDQLRRIAEKQTGSTRAGSWCTLWPEPPEAAPCISTGRSADRWKSLYLSYHRTAFWQEVAGLLRLLHAHAERMDRDDPWDPGPPPTWWTVRGVPPGSEKDVAAWLASFDTWIRDLYPTGAALDLKAFPWELNALIGAVLASTSKINLAKAFWKSGDQGRPEDGLFVPDGIDALKSNPRLRIVLQDSDRLVSARIRGSVLTRRSLSLIALGGGTQDLGKYLFRTNGKPRIADQESGSIAVVAANLGGGVVKHVPRNLIANAVHSPKVLIDQVRDDPFVLWEYHASRSIFLGHPCSDTEKLPTLHRLLWGDLSSEDLEHWAIKAWEAPSVGLPVTVALCFLANALRRTPAESVGSANGPHTWEFGEGKSVLAKGRRLQFGLTPANAAPPEIDCQEVAVERTAEWEIPPHAGFFLPLLLAEPKPDAVSYQIYCDALLLLTACDGDERILDALVRFGPGAVPFEERWNWRSRIHFPPNIWKLLEKAIRLPGPPGLIDDFLRELGDYSGSTIAQEDFVDIRIDLSLDTEEDQEIARTIRRGDEPEDLPEKLKIDRKKLAKDLIVRIGQISEPLVHDQPKFVKTFPKMGNVAVENVMAQVSAALQLPRFGADSKGPEIVILPELTIPQTEIRTLRDHAAKYGRAYLAGLIWRVLPTAARPAATTSVSKYWLVNEAELAIPIGAEGRGPVTVRFFRVRKPRPAHLEHGFAQALTSTRGSSWSILPGSHWYRFVHGNWGDFSVAICSDILDSAPWRSLQGEILHLFMCTFNKDVDLFDALTWVRAYEGAMNVVSVNHGFFGGSFLWTPKHRGARELARLRGNHLNLIADVTLPVQEILENQLDGVSKAMIATCCDWLGHESESGDYKAPPPGFERRRGSLK